MNSKTSCERQADLVTYLYDEASRDERHSFEVHLEECATCRGELNGFASVRNSLGAWNLSFEPSSSVLEIAIKRNSIETLRDVLKALTTWPAWVKVAGGSALATAGLLVALSIAGTRVDVRQGTISFGAGRADTIASTAENTQISGRTPDQDFKLTKAQIESIISERVAAATAENRQRQDELSVRVATLSAQLASVSQSRGRVAVELASLRAEQRALAARGQATLGEWLFAANGSREAWGGNDERDN